MTATCTIVRFRFKGENEVLYEGVPLEDAKELCNQEWSNGDGWFDGWQLEEDEEDDDAEV
jgi:hypothetical protein